MSSTLPSDPFVNLSADTVTHHNYPVTVKWAGPYESPIYALSKPAFNVGAEKVACRERRILSTGCPRAVNVYPGGVTVSMNCLDTYSSLLQWSYASDMIIPPAYLYFVRGTLASWGTALYGRRSPNLGSPKYGKGKRKHEISRERLSWEIDLQPQPVIFTPIIFAARYRVKTQLNPFSSDSGSIIAASEQITVR